MDGKYHKPLIRKPQATFHPTRHSKHWRGEKSIISKGYLQKKQEKKNISKTICVLSKKKRRPGSKGVVKSSQPNAQIQR
jgi:hypothetical protein